MAAQDKSTLYLDKNGEGITAVQWTNFRAKDDYKYLRRYKSDKMYIEVEWLGIVKKSKEIPKEYWKLFSVNVFNIITVGDRPGTFVNKQVEDTVLTRQFRDSTSAMKHYQRILADKKLLQVEEDYYGEESIIEIGNAIGGQEPMKELLIVMDVCKSFPEPALLSTKEVETTSAVFGSW